MINVVKWSSLGAPVIDAVKNTHVILTHIWQLESSAPTCSENNHFLRGVTLNKATAAHRKAAFDTEIRAKADHETVMVVPQPKFMSCNPITVGLRLNLYALI